MSRLLSVDKKIRFKDKVLIYVLRILADQVYQTFWYINILTLNLDNFLGDSHWGPNWGKPYQIRVQSSVQNLSP